MSLHQDLLSLRRLLTMKPGTDGYIYVDAFDETNKNVEAYNYLTLGIRPLDSREISNAIIFLSILSFAGDFVVVIISFNLISFYLGL